MIQLKLKTSSSWETNWLIRSNNFKQKLWKQNKRSFIDHRKKKRVPFLVCCLTKSEKRIKLKKEWVRYKIYRSEEDKNSPTDRMFMIFFHTSYSKIIRILWLQAFWVGVDLYAHMVNRCMVVWTGISHKL